MVGEKFSHYHVVKKLGEGGMGVVYRVRDEALDRDAAVKVLPASSFRDTTARARLIREAKSAAALNHPNICTVYEVGEFEDQAFIAMELVEGRSLADRVAEGPMSTSETARYGLQIADALAHAHDRGIVHRDLKCANIVIGADGRAKVLDFGLAKRSVTAEMATAAIGGDTVTQPGMIVGTLGYMAPEQLCGAPADMRTDVWALGVVLYEMLTGTRPFAGTSPYNILNTAPRPLPQEIKPELSAIVMRCLERDPEQRYQRGGDVRTALEVVQCGSIRMPVANAARARAKWMYAASAIAIVVVSAAVTFWLQTRTGSIDSVAVLPLDNFARNADEDYVAEGLQDALIADLARLGGFRKVIARSSVARYRKSDKSVREIAKELGVQAIVTGAVMRSGDKIRVTAQLIRAEDEQNLWAERYERQFRDVLDLQNEIVSAIARGIKTRITPEQQAQLARKRPVNPEAHEAYLKGMFYLNKMTPESIDKGIASLQLAVEKDPGSALPYAALALGYTTIGHIANAPPGTLHKAKAAAKKALEIDPNCAEAHQALAEAKAYDEKDWDWPALEQMYKRVLELNPSMPQAHGHYGWYHVLFGRREQGMTEIKKAAELDPLNPLYASWVTQQYTFPAGGGPQQFGDALAYARKTLELDPQSPFGLADLGDVYITAGKIDEAIPYFEKARKINPAFGWELGIVFAMKNQHEKAHKIITDLQGPALAWNRWGIASIYAALGEKDKMFEWLEQAYEHRHPYIPWIRVFTPFLKYKEDPRFKSLLQRMKLPPPDATV